MAPRRFVHLALICAACGSESLGERAGPSDAGATAPDTTPRADASTGGDAGSLDPDAYVEPLPDTFIENPPPAHTNQTTLRLRLTSSVAFSRFECALDTEPLAPCQLLVEREGLAEGPHTFQAVSVSPQGQRDPSPAEIAFEVDLTPPETRLVDAPPALSGDDRFTVTFEADEPARFACALDGGALRPCESPHALGPVSEGVHALAVTATDLAGNADPTPASAMWRVDRTPPDTRIVEPPPAELRVDSVEIPFISEDFDLAGYQCALDGAARAPCESPARLAGLAEGPHRFEVAAVDTLGLVDPTPAAAEFAVTVAAPETVIVQAPPARTGNAVASFVFGPDGAAFDCALDDGQAVPCEPVWDTPPLPEGPHSLTVTAHDGQGHRDATPEVARWVVDLSPPELSLLNVPPGLTRESRLEVAFQAVDRPEPGPVTVRCQLDDEPLAPCESPFVRDALFEGEHLLALWAEDDVGNISFSPLEVRMTVDRTAPTTAVLAAPPAVTNETDARIEFAAVPDGRVECENENEIIFECESPLVFSALSEGEHRVFLRARDAAGNVEDPPQVVTWIVDTTPPDAILTDAPPALDNHRQATFTFLAEPAADAQFECRLDDAAFAPCASPLRLQDLSDGPHTLAVRAVDAVGNADPSPASHAWSVDATPPETRWAEAPGDFTNALLVRFIAESEPDAIFECRPDAILWFPCVMPVEIPGLPDGPHTLEVRAIDVMGNVDPTPLLARFTVDRAPPRLGFRSGPAPVSLTADARFELDASEPVAAQCALDAAPPAPCPDPLLYRDLAEGPHALVVTGADLAGNPAPAPARWEWTVDALPPAPPGAPTLWPGAGTVLLEWAAGGPDVTGYRILRGVQGDLFPTVVAEVGAVNLYLDTGRTNDVPTGYALQALDAWGRASDPGEPAITVPTRIGLAEPLPAVPPSAAAAALLPDATVLLAFADEPPVRWDPSLDEVLPAPADASLGTAALVHLPDGRLAAGFGGVPAALRALAADTWSPLAAPAAPPRALPAALVLADGRLLFAGGADPTQPVEGRADVYDPAGDTWEAPIAAPVETMVAAPYGTLSDDGAALLPGPFDPGQHLDSQGFSPLASRGGEDTAAVLARLPDGEILATGGALPAGRYDPVDDRWRPAGANLVPRAGGFAVLLPDGGVAVLGGLVPGEVVEHYDPFADRFEPGGVLARPASRGAALLLPSGEVLVAGQAGGDRYRPWYLQAGPRPEITAAPGGATYGEEVEVRARGRLGVAGWVLLRAGAVSGGRDPNQRHVSLTARALDPEPDRWAVSLPVRSEEAPPGPYLLFALDPRGVPSPGVWLQVR